MEKAIFRVGTDVGGTFTDVWVISNDGRERVFKTPSTKDSIRGIIEGLRQAADFFDLDMDDFCSHIERFGHGNTVGVNALLTGTAAKTAIITTAGFRDTMEIGRLKLMYAGLSDLEVTDYYLRGRYKPFIDREWIVEVPERIDFQGNIIQPLDEETAQQKIRVLAQNGTEAVAICTLWSPVNPDHEKRLRQIVAKEIPDAYINMSHEISPVVGEYARMSTTAANAALGPVVSRYLIRLEDAFGNHGLQCPILVMTGAGGVVSATSAAQLPASALFSGPIAGVIGCQAMAKQIGRQNVLTIDVGGTSFDVGLIVDNAPLMCAETDIGGAVINLPSVDVDSIGAGGGSIAKINHGNLYVGPQSAGAKPGPACYGRGGTAPTTTDADLILGIYNPKNFLGGEMLLDLEAASRAVTDNIAKPLGMGLMEAAWGIRQVFESRMADLLRRVTIERGHDPREFCLFACGGAGPSHAWALCHEIGVKEFVVPATATAFSAFGTGMCDIRHSAQRPVRLRLPDTRVTDTNLLELGSALAEAQKEVTEGLSRDNMAYQSVILARSIGLRYRGQTLQLDVPYDMDKMTAEGLTACITEFEKIYESLFGRGSGFRQAGFEISYVRVIGTGMLALPEINIVGDELKEAGMRSVVFDNPKKPIEIPIYQVDSPKAGLNVKGPCIIESYGHTLVVPPGGSALSDEFSNFRVTIDI